MTSLQSPIDPRRRADIRNMLVAHARADAARDAPAVPPEWRRPARRIGLAVACAAVVATTASVLLAPDPEAPPSYASWTAVPQAAPPPNASRDDIERWASKCSDLGVGGVAIQGVPARPQAAARRNILVDRRGDFTYCVDVSLGQGTPTDPLIALSGLKTEQHQGLNNMSATVYDKPFAVPGNGNVLVLGGDLDTPPADGARDTSVVRLDAYQLYGLSGNGVTGVELVLANGLRVTATVHDGIWGAWWPSDHGQPARSVIEVHTASGFKTVDPATVRLRIQ